MDNLQPGTAPKVTPADIEAEIVSSPATHIVPTVGRVVWYWPNPNEEYVCIEDDQPMRADVCHVNSDGTINLSVNDHAGNQIRRHGITLHQGDAAGCSLPRPFATWMPFQRGQAMKTAEAEAKAVGSFQTEHERLNLAMLAEQVRELRLKNDGTEAENELRQLALAGLRELEVTSDQPPEVPGMPPHQARMRFERDELSARLTKLKFFMGTDAFDDLDEHEQELLEEQCDCMDRYLRVLQDRIALFNEQQDAA